MALGTQYCRSQLIYVARSPQRKSRKRLTKHQIHQHRTCHARNASAGVAANADQGGSSSAQDVQKRLDRDAAGNQRCATYALHPRHRRRLKPSSKHHNSSSTSLRTGPRKRSGERSKKTDITRLIEAHWVDPVGGPRTGQDRASSQRMNRGATSQTLLQYRGRTQKTRPRGIT